MPLKLKLYGFSKNWYIRGTIKGVRVFESSGTPKKPLADAYRIKREREIYEGVALGQRQPATFAEAMIAYVHHARSERYLEPLLEHFKERPLTEIGQAEIDHAANALYPGCRASTRVRQVYTPMIAILNHAADAKLAGAARQKIKRPKIENVPVEWARDDYLPAFLPHCNPRLRALVLFMSCNGPRVSEAIRLRPAAFTRGCAYLGKTKNGKPRKLPLAPVVEEAIAAIMPDDPMKPVFGYSSRWSVNNALQDAARRAGLPYLSPHKIGRHTFAARMLSQGVTLKVLKDAGGWASIQVVDDRYGHLERSEADSAVLATAKSVENALRLSRPKRKKAAGQ